MTENARLLKFIIAFLGFSAALMFAGGLFCWVMDPYDVYGNTRFTGMRLLDEKQSPYRRLSAPAQLRRLRPENIILGTSRAQSLHSDCFPESDADRREPFFNLGVQAASPYENYLNLRYAVAVNVPKTVVYGLDFFAFNTYLDPPPDFDSRRFEVGPGNRPAGMTLRDFLAINLSSNSFSDSFEMLLHNMNTRLRNKTIPPASANRNLSPGQTRGHFLQQYKYFFKQSYIVEGHDSFSIYAPQTGAARQLDYLRKIVRLCRENNIRLYLFISPEHVMWREGTSRMGLRREFERWKRELVEIAAPAAPGEVPIPLWDFSGRNTITTEPLPRDDNSRMVWYYDPSHYDSRAGCVMLNRILNRGNALFVPPDDFGTLLNREDIP